MRAKTKLLALLLVLVVSIPIFMLPVSAASSATPPPGILESQVDMEIRDGYPMRDVQVQYKDKDGAFESTVPPCFRLEKLLDGAKERDHYGVCCKKKAPPGTSKEKFGIDLDAMKGDSKGWYISEGMPVEGGGTTTVRRDVKWIFKVFYYATKQSTWEYFESNWNINRDYQFLVAVSLAYRREGKSNKISATNGYNLSYTRAADYLIDLAADDADKIGSKIQVGSGIAWLKLSEDVYDVMCIYGPLDESSTSQSMIIFTPDDVAEKGSITITKKSGNGELLAGATFQIFDAKGNVVSQFTNGITTNVQGVATTGAEALDLGKYTVVETKMPSGCRAVTEAEAKAMGGYLNSSGQLCFDVEVSAQKNTLNIKIDAINNKNSGGVGMYKYGVNGEGLPNAKFALYDNPEASGEPLCTKLSDENGKVFFAYDEANLEYGKTYYLKEIEPPAGYYMLYENAVYEVFYDGVSRYWHGGYEGAVNYPYGVPTGIDTNVKLYSVLFAIAAVTFIGAVLVYRKEKANKVC